VCVCVYPQLPPKPSCGRLPQAPGLAVNRWIGDAGAWGSGLGSTQEFGGAGRVGLPSLCTPLCSRAPAQPLLPGANRGRATAGGVPGCGDPPPSRGATAGRGQEGKGDVSSPQCAQGRLHGPCAMPGGNPVVAQWPLREGSGTRAWFQPLPTARQAEPLHSIWGESGRSPAPLTSTSVLPERPHQLHAPCQPLPRLLWGRKAPGSFSPTRQMPLAWHCLPQHCRLEEFITSLQQARSSGAALCPRAAEPRPEPCRAGTSCSTRPATTTPPGVPRCMWA